MRITGGDLLAFAAKLARDGKLDAQDAADLRDLTLIDHVVHEDERKALKAVLEGDAPLAEDARQLLEAYLDVEDAGVRRLLAQDAAWGTASFQALAEEAKSLRGRRALQAGLIAFQVDPGARSVLGLLADGAELPEAWLAFLADLQHFELGVADVPAGALQSPAFITALLASAPKLAREVVALVEEEAENDPAWAAKLDLTQVLVRAATDQPDLVLKLPAEHRSAEVWAAACAQKGGLWWKAPKRVREQRAVVVAALSTPTKAVALWEALPTELKTDRDIVLQVARRAPPTFLKQLDDVDPGGAWLEDEELVRTALASDGRCLEALVAHDPRIADDRELVELALASDGRALAFASEKLRSNRAVVELAVQNRGDAFAFAPSELRSDEKLVKKLCHHDVTVLSCASAELRDDAELTLWALKRANRRKETPAVKLGRNLRRNRGFLRRALVYRADVLAQAPASIRRDQDFVESVAPLRIGVVAHADPSLLDDKGFARRMLEQGGATYAFYSERIRDDPELLKLALRDHPAALEFASERLRSDPALVELGIRRNGIALSCATWELKNDKELLLKALPTAPYLVEEIGEDALADPEVILAAVEAMPLALRYAHPDLWADDAFLEEVSRLNPLALDGLPPPRRAAFLDDHPGVANRRRRLLRKAKDLGIDFPERLGTAAQLEELMRNRTRPRDDDDERPLAIYIFPKHDYNGAFSFNEIPDLGRAYRVLYFEADSDEEVREALREAGEQGERAELVNIGGHGRQHLIAFGATDPALNPADLEDERAYIDLGDGAQLGPALRDACQDGCQLILGSCSTGLGREEHENIANFVADLVPQANVWAPIFPTNNRMILDDDGRFVDPGFWEGDLVTYRREAKGSPPVTKDGG